MAQKLDKTLDDIIAIEEGSLSERAFCEAMQRMIDSGMAYRLQGWYGRTADALIEAGMCHPRGH